MLQMIRYSLKEAIGNKEILFYGLAFPIILGLLFNFALGALLENDMVLTIPVAVVDQREDNDIHDNFLYLIESLASEGEDSIIQPYYITLSEAEEKLDNNDITGIYIITEEGVRLLVQNQGIMQSILVMIADRYVQVQATIERVAAYNMELIPLAVYELTNEVSVIQELQTGRPAVDMRVYTLITFIAMSCFMGAHTGQRKVFLLLANKSALAARRSITPTNRIKILTADFIASVFTHFVYACIALLFFHFIMHIDFGTNVPLILLCALISSAIGISFGMFVATICGGVNEKTLSSIFSGVVMGLMVLAGMMTIDVRIFIRDNFYILDRLNPITYAVDAFYSLTGFSDYRVLTQNLIWMTGITIVLCIVSGFILGRKNYDSI